MRKAVMIRCLIGWCAGLLAAAVAQAQTQNIVYFPEWGVHLQPYYRDRGFGPGDFPRAETYYDHAISIPLYAGLTEADQDTVVAALEKAMGG